MHYRAKIVCYFLLMWSNVLWAQDAEKDMSSLLQRSYGFWQKGAYDSALMLLNGEEKRRYESNQLFNANCYYLKGLIFQSLNLDENGLSNLDSAYTLALSDSAFVLAGMSRLIQGQIFEKQSLLITALEKYREAYTHYHSAGNETQMASVANEIGNVYMQLKIYEDARKEYEQAWQFYEKGNDSTMQGMILSNLAHAQSRLARYDQAIENFKRALEIKKRAHSPRSQAFTLQYFGELWLKKNELDSAEKYLLRCYDIKGQLQDLPGLSETGNWLGRLYIAQKRPRLARSYLDSAEQRARETQSLSLLIDNLDQQKAWQRNWGSAARALIIDDQYDQLTDSLFREERLKVEALQADYALKEKEQERQIAAERAQTVQFKNQQQQVVIWIVLLSLVALGGLAYTIWRSRRLTAEKNELLESQNQLIEQQKNDIRHRAKNHMSMISYILTLMRRETKDQEVVKHVQSAQHLMLTFSSLEMHLYDKPTDSVIELGAYLKEWREKFLENLPPAQAPYDIAIACEPLELSSKLVVPIALIITELATNSFKYVCLEGKNTRFEVLARLEGKTLVLQLKDNGSGFNENRQEGMGWQIIKTLCHSIKGKMQLESERGFHFELTVSAEK